MYKKIIVSFFLVGILFFGLSKADVQSVNIRYCEDVENSKATADKTFFIESGKEKEICFYFYTNSVEPMEVVYDFTTTALNSQGNKTCSTDTNVNNPFAKYFIGSGQRKIVVSPDQPYLVKEKFVAPIGMSGEINGCIVYTLSKPAKSNATDGSMFSIVIRKQNFLSFFVGSMDSIVNEVQLLKNPGGIYSTNSKIKTNIDEEGNLSLDFLVKNNGNMAQNVTITGKIYNFLGFEKIYESEAASVGPGETKNIIINVGILPAYKGFFTVISNVKNEPIFGFDSSNVDPKIKEGGVQKEKATIYIFSWVTLIAIVVLLLVLVKIFLPRRTRVIEK